MVTVLFSFFSLLFSSMNWKLPLALVYNVLLVIPQSFSRSFRRCIEPELDYRSSMNREPLHESFLMMEPAVSMTYDVEAFVNIRRTELDGELGYDQCTWQTGYRYNSTCPHHYVINFDPNRRPERLLEVKCNCGKNQRCLNGAEGSWCAPITYSMYVLRKNGCDHGVYTYTQTVEQITVGCTCVHEKEEGFQYPAHRVSPE